jgi:hypothetical protein
VEGRGDGGIDEAVLNLTHIAEAAQGISSSVDLPRYCIIGARPVKLVATEEGGLDCLAYDWETGELARDMSYLTRAVLPDEEVDVVSAEEFERHVARLRTERRQ